MTCKPPPSEREEHLARETLRGDINPPYSPELIERLGGLLDVMVEVNGAENVGVTEIDPDAFAFPLEGDE